MARPKLPFAARIHAGLAHRLDWTWPAGAAWAYADALAHAPHAAELHFFRVLAIESRVRALRRAAHKARPKPGCLPRSAA